MIKWVVFDLGDVVLRSTKALKVLADLMTADEARFTEAYHARRTEYDLHTDPQAFWSGIATDAGAPQPDRALVAELVRVDDLGWCVTDSECLSLVRDVEAGGRRVAVLSNAPSSMGRLVETQRWSAPFSHLLFSGDLGLVKPDPAIYEELLTQLDAQADQVAFLDNRDDNVAAAIAAGIHGFVFSTASRARSDLRSAGLPV